MTNEAYQDFIYKASKYWVWKRNDTRSMYYPEFRDYELNQRYDSLLREWVGYIWDIWVDLDSNDAEVLNPETDLEMIYALYDGYLCEWEPIEPPLIPGTNEYYDFEHYRR
jgi:hypothetical protein